jgi:hypothetical protein
VTGRAVTAVDGVLSTAAIRVNRELEGVDGARRPGWYSHVERRIVYWLATNTTNGEGK